MQFKKKVLWCIVNGRGHDQLEEEDRKIAAYMPLVETLFPGINYYSHTGFNEVYHKCLVPVVKKLYPELATVPMEAMEADAMAEVTEVLPSNGYEWQDNDEWMMRLQTLLEGQAA